MTITPKRNSFIVHCDFCPEYFEVESDDFKEARREIKFRYWQTLKDHKDDWVNKCLACQEEGR